MNDLILPKGWEWKKLGEICTKIGSGATPSGGQNSYKDSGIALIRSMNVYDDGFINKGLVFIDDVQADKLSNVVVEENDVLLNITGASIARCCIVPSLVLPARVNQHVSILRVKPNIASPKFVHKFLIAPATKQKLLNASAFGATREAFTKSMIENFAIPLPLLTEQRRIVAKIDAAFTRLDAAIQLQKQNLARTEEMKKSVLEEVFGNEAWEVIELGKIVSFRNGINYSQRSKGDAIQIVGVKDFKSNFWVPTENLDTIVIDGDLSPADYLIENDILTVRSNGNPELIGRCMLARKITGKVSHSGFTIRIRITDSDIFPSYLCHYLKSDYVRKILIESGTGASIKSLNQGALSTVSIPKPPLSIQEALVRHLDRAFAQIALFHAAQTARLHHLETLKSSILSEAFQGKL